jgi:hypothetical protein
MSYKSRDLYTIPFCIKGSKCKNDLIACEECNHYSKFEEKVEEESEQK